MPKLRVRESETYGRSGAGRTGLVHEAVLADHADLSGFDVYVAGPPAMVRAARAAFLARGLPADRLFHDSFEPAADARPPAAAR